MSAAAAPLGRPEVSKSVLTALVAADRSSAPIFGSRFDFGEEDFESCGSLTPLLLPAFRARDAAADGSDTTTFRGLTERCLRLAEEGGGGLPGMPVTAQKSVADNYSRA